MPHLLIHLIKLLVWAGEHMPDDPRVGWKCIGSGSVLAAVVFLPQRFTEEQPGLFAMQVISVVAGTVLLLFGLFVFFRRAVWKLQDKRAKRTISLFGK